MGIQWGKKIKCAYYVAKVRNIFTNLRICIFAADFIIQNLYLQGYFLELIVLISEQGRHIVELGFGDG